MNKPNITVAVGKGMHNSWVGMKIPYLWSKIRISWANKVSQWLKNIFVFLLKFDVPTNFVRPEDAELDLLDPDTQVDNFSPIDVLDAEGLPQPPNPDIVPFR